MSKFFCPLPWIHQFIQADGIKMCCSAQTKLDVTPKEFFQSGYISNIKQSITQGVVPQDCGNCLRLEQQGYSSTRTLALNDWNYTIDDIPNEILYLDLRHSNLCNFSCRSCEPGFSSEISREIQKNLNLRKYHKSTNIHTENIKSQENITDLLLTVQRINFTGGEPLLIKKNINILEKLIEIGNTNCELLITTNGSVVNDNLLDLIQKFDRVHWTISIDAFGQPAEYIRYGTVWSSVDSNINQILQSKQSVALNTVITSYSLLDLSSLLQYFKMLKNSYSTQPLEIWFHICSTPEFLNPTVINDSQKIKALDELAKSIDILSRIDSNPSRSIATLESLQNNLKECIIKTSLYNTFVSYTKELDAIRNQNFKQTFGLDL